MNPRVRGLLFLVGFIIFAVVFCGLIPFVVMPGGGTGVALPVIEVPGEVVVEDWLPGFNLTNSIIGTLVTNVLVLLIVFILWRMTRGWTREIPSRLQGMFEVLIDGFRGFSRGIAGDRLNTTPLLWPLVATIFFFLLTANYMKLLPGVETVGKMHCAYPGQSGFAMLPGSGTLFGNSYRLWVDEPLNAGTSQTAEGEALCNDYFKKQAIPKDGFTAETVEEIAARDAAFVALLDQLPSDLELLEQAEARVTEEAGEEELDDAEFEARVEETLVDLEEARAEEYQALLEETAERADGDVETSETARINAERLPLVEDTDYEFAYNYHTYADARIASAETAAVLQPRLETIDALLEEIRAEDTEETMANREALREELIGHLTAAPAEMSGATTEELFGLLELTQFTEMTEESEDALIEALEAEYDAQIDTLNQARTQLRYPFATLIFTPEQLETGAKPYIFHITPFVRGPATDLSFTFGLSILAIIVVQIYGVRALGPAYFEKFINLSAIGNIGKRPLGVIDFIVGLIEIISEIGKMVSLAFRLFGNLFAGGIALMAMTFLVAVFVPGVIYGLELIIGAVQALVFAVLTLVFSVQAMESHHGDDHHDDEHGHEAAH
ncbi:MAG: F0F1 ATP synthase subunit A [Chloroflexota bacterium]